MNFSEAFQQTKKLVRFSPSGRYVASCSQHRLAIRDASTLSLLSVHTCVDAIDTVQWSPDSLLVMCGMFQRSVVQVCCIPYIVHKNASPHIYVDESLYYGVCK